MAIRSMGNFDVYETLLILCHLPKDFRSILHRNLNFEFGQHFLTFRYLCGTRMPWVKLLRL